MQSYRWSDTPTGNNWTFSPFTSDGSRLGGVQNGPFNVGNNYHDGSGTATPSSPISRRPATFSSSPHSTLVPCTESLLQVEACTVIVVGLWDSPRLLGQIQKLMSALQQHCGPVRAAHRFPVAPPPCLLRPQYPGVVLAVTFMNEAGASAAVWKGVRGLTHIEGWDGAFRPSLTSHDPCTSQSSIATDWAGSHGFRVSPIKSFRLNPQDAEDCRSTFTPTHELENQAEFMSWTDGGVAGREREWRRRSNRYSISQKLWFTLCSELSWYARVMDWKSAEAAALRGDAIVIDEECLCAPLCPLKEPLTKGREDGARGKGGGFLGDTAFLSFNGNYGHTDRIRSGSGGGGDTTHHTANNNNNRSNSNNNTSTGSTGVTSSPFRGVRAALGLGGGGEERREETYDALATMQRLYSSGSRGNSRWGNKESEERSRNLSTSSSSSSSRPSSPGWIERLVMTYLMPGEDNSSSTDRQGSGSSSSVVVGGGHCSRGSSSSGVEEAGGEGRRGGGRGSPTTGGSHESDGDGGLPVLTGLLPRVLQWFLPGLSLPSFYSHRPRRLLAPSPTTQEARKRATTDGGGGEEGSMTCTHRQEEEGQPPAPKRLRVDKRYDDEEDRRLPWPVLLPFAEAPNHQTEEVAVASSSSRSLLDAAVGMNHDSSSHSFLTTTSALDGESLPLPAFRHTTGQKIMVPQGGGKIPYPMYRGGVMPEEQEAWAAAAATSPPRYEC